MKEFYDNKCMDYKYDINKKSEEIQILKLNYEKTIHDVRIYI
jgi:hypothetical protein